MQRDAVSSAAPCPSEEPAGRPLPEHPDVLLFTVEAAFLLGLSPRTLEALRLRGGGPPFVAVTRKAIRYRRGDIDVFIAMRRRKTTSDPGCSADTPDAPHRNGFVG